MEWQLRKAFASFASALALLQCLGAAAKPNIVYILTDDQDLKLGSLDVQPAVKSLLAEQGTVFSNAFVTTPVCCPSRSSILTGKYTHNHHTYENQVAKGCCGASWRERNENKTMGVYMSMAGYRTGFFGKYLNNYAMKASGMNVSHVPPGWTRWYTLQGNSRYYNYTMSNDGQPEKHKDNYTLDYLTDRLKEQAVDFIHQSAHDNSPVFMYIATPAPHRPATPAPQYANKFAGKPAPRTPSYGHAGTNKHWIISTGTPPMNSTIVKAVDELYEMRLETLLSVDDLVTAVVNALEDENLLENTFVFYNSDHGYHLGQFNQQGEKRQPYDEDVRVPLIVRGPGVKKNVTTDALALNIDLAPTFIDLADWPVPEDMDGMSLKSVLLGGDPQDSGTQFLVEYFGEGYNTTNHSGCFYGGPLPYFNHDCKNNTFLALRALGSGSQGNVFAEFFLNDTVPMNTSQIYFKEYYDIDKDLWQVTNTVKELPNGEVKQLQGMLEAFHHCSGSSCTTLRTKKML